MWRKDLLRMAKKVYCKKTTDAPFLNNCGMIFVEVRPCKKFLLACYEEQDKA